jgi:hypothetical protein
VSNRVVLAAPLTGDASIDARAVVDAIRAGRTYSVVDAISPDVLVSLDPQAIRPGSPLPSWAEPVTIRGERGEERLEIRSAQAPGDPPIPWVLTNWIYPRGEPEPTPATPPSVREASLATVNAGWVVEKDPVSTGRVESTESGIVLDYQLAGGSRGNQYVAAAVPLSQTQPFDAVVFHGQSSRPMRVSVQLRFAAEGRRWVKSVYLDAAGRDVVVRTTEMAGAETAGQPMPPSESAGSLLFVVDLVNARPGDQGRIQINNIRLAR